MQLDYLEMASARIDREYAVLIMNCDRTCDLEPASLLFHDLSPRVNVHFLKWDLHQRNEVIQQLRERKLPDADLQNCELLGVFVVHAHESRLNINEENSGIGYYKVFQALKRATEGHIIVVVQHDETYADRADESLLVSSTVRRKLLSQFSNEEMCGPQGYLFSWNNYPSEVHLEETVKFVNKRLDIPVERVTVSRKRREPKTSNPETVSSKRNNPTEIETKLPSLEERNKQNEVEAKKCKTPQDFEQSRAATLKTPSSVEKGKRQNSDAKKERSALKSGSNTSGKQNPKLDSVSEQHRIIGDLTNDRALLKNLLPKFSSEEFVEVSAVYFITSTNKVCCIRGLGEFTNDWHLKNKKGPVHTAYRENKGKTDCYIFALKTKSNLVKYYSKKKSKVDEKVKEFTGKNKN